MERRVSKMYPVLNRPKQLGGVEHSLAVANMVVGVALVFNWQQWQFIPVFIFIHFVLHYASRHEPEIRKVYRKYSSQADYYEPFPRERGDKTKNPRPIEWGKGYPC